MSRVAKEIGKDEVQVFVIGDSGFQNEMLAQIIHAQLKYECHSATKFCYLKSPEREKNTILLIDCHALDLNGVMEVMNSKMCVNSAFSHVALFNLCPLKNIEKYALDSGVKGFFYKDDSVASFLKGLPLILGGELWIPRDKIAELYLKNNLTAPSVDAPLSMLTQRENQIFMLVLAGKSNDQIADMLNISVNTVKTHMYKAFGKVGVNSRFQAVCWAAKNLRTTDFPQRVGISERAV